MFVYRHLLVKLYICFHCEIYAVCSEDSNYKTRNFEKMIGDEAFLMATFANKAKHKAMRGPIKVGDTGKFGKYGENDNFATLANKTKPKAIRGPIKVGDTGKFGENDNFATFANKAKHKAMRGPIKVGDTGKFGKYGENDNFATIASRAWKFTNGLIYNGY